MRAERGGPRGPVEAARCRSVIVRKRNWWERIRDRLSDAALRTSFLFFEYLLPKRTNAWCFCTWKNAYPHTIDNPRGVFEEVKNDGSIIKIILLKTSRSPGLNVTEGKNVHFVPVESIRGAYEIARSKVIILGYGLSGVSSFSRYTTKRHHVIQLWHGIPLKRIGKLFPGEHFWNAETSKYTATVCSADRDRELMTMAFAPVPRVWITGLPRNDLIMKPEGDLPSDYRDQLTALRQQIAGRRFILYAPTWRNEDSGIYPFSNDEWSTLERFLRDHGATMGIRAHANRRSLDGPQAGALASSIFYVNSYPDVNLVLRLTDILVTDYSSIYIDFLLTGRPILNFTYDLDNYVGERGFLYPLEDAMPDRPFRTFGELLTRLDTLLSGRELNPIQYKNSKDLFHGHSGNSSKAVAERIMALSALSTAETGLDQR